ncbi:hypothetical protein SYNPS1DRAFT_29206 [Syncephalis pseudoplumigaleata]|uniref:Uncharacterized protein n=1 Tax=Syncephalis pseudoplumigaleata TaxID=1712513 RepID=A0A4P9YY85_9FUNG|nr:hypothetical protein SYNPS1DRAFT_29206 [Syncephalis pseudoplumigaleata]|eukprot:RKP25047.1 hypothetical protein SYNPS1DRAFT_29206 [Syncephalis pseudoplumigaleata]
MTSCDNGFAKKTMITMSRLYRLVAILAISGTHICAGMPLPQVGMLPMNNMMNMNTNMMATSPNMVGTNTNMMGTNPSGMDNNMPGATMPGATMPGATTPGATTPTNTGPPMTQLVMNGIMMNVGTPKEREYYNNLHKDATPAEIARANQKDDAFHNQKMTKNLMNNVIQMKAGMGMPMMGGMSPMMGGMSPMMGMA